MANRSNVLQGDLVKEALGVEVLNDLEPPRLALLDEVGHSQPRVLLEESDTVLWS